MARNGLSVAEYFRCFPTTTIDIETLSRIVIKIEEVKKAGFGHVKVCLANGNIDRIEKVESELITK